MKKTFLFFILFVLILVGCSNEQILLSGESKNWKGKYLANIDGNNENGSYEFHFKKGNSKTNFKNIEVNINNGKTVIRDENFKGTTISTPKSCRGCSVTSKDKPIKVLIKWNGENAETFYLK
ncbi:hypothetical protein E2K98_30015 [Bacillus salipaludis]|uniref:Lipoprotein n=1 Tax=Bacillus salipaludis TaxID=2547811 RepID=A0A4R5VHG1_9BACI|nr:hypothetical protein [Bacillus salipaludis]MDQ6596405.1 hypothetical protein [Bacillus salipaludis]TDK53746.1 hypothetical protein E2K98_30015 [Bacillus salipaludis]